MSSMPIYEVCHPYDIEQNWNNTTKIVPAGSLIISSDKNNFKIGTGLQTFSQLPYFISKSFQWFPTGMIVECGGISTPSYTLSCNGNAISRTIYATLFGVIGTKYGSGDGSTTFNLPNESGKIIVY